MNLGAGCRRDARYGRRRPGRRLQLGHGQHLVSGGRFVPYRQMGRGWRRDRMERHRRRWRFGRWLGGLDLWNQGCRFVRNTARRTRFVEVTVHQSVGTHRILSHANRRRILGFRFGAKRHRKRTGGGSRCEEAGLEHDPPQSTPQQPDHSESDDLQCHLAFQTGLRSPEKHGDGQDQRRAHRDPGPPPKHDSQKQSHQELPPVGLGDAQQKPVRRPGGGGHQPHGLQQVFDQVAHGLGCWHFSGSGTCP